MISELMQTWQGIVQYAEKNWLKKRKMRVWHTPQVPGKPFYVPVENEKEVKKFLDALAGYDIFQFNNNIKPDFSNASGNEFIGIYCKAG